MGIISPRLTQRIVMKFAINPLIGSTSQLQNIDEEEYQQIINARKRVFDILFFEEKFAYIIDNFYELENEAFKKTLPIRGSFESVSKIVDDTHIFNRRIMNLLTTSRSYLYQASSDLKYIVVGKDNLGQKFKEKSEQLREESFIYYFFWEFRNYVQHHSVPLMGNSRRINKIDQENLVTGIKRRVCEHTLEFTINVGELQADPEFFKYARKTNVSLEKKSHLEKLNNFPHKLNIRPLIREYISLLAEIHEEFRKQLALSFQQSETLLRNKIEYYCGNKKSESCFEILKQDEAGNVIERFDIFLRPIERRAKMVQEYSHLSAIIHQYVTSG